MFEVGSYEVQSFKVESFEVGLFEVWLFEVQSVNRVNNLQQVNSFLLGPHRGENILIIKNQHKSFSESNAHF